METRIKVFYEKLKEKDRSLVVKLQGARLLWNDLEEPRAYQDGDRLKYAATVLVPENLLPEFDKAVDHVAELNLGKTAAQTLRKFRMDIPHNPIRRQENDGGEIYYTLRATMPAEVVSKATGASKKRTPDVRRRNGTPVDWNDDSTVDEEGNTIKQDKPYNGCYVNLVFDLYYTTAGRGGVFPGLRMVQFVADGEPLGGARQSNDEFVEDLSVTDDEDDDMPF